MNIEADTRAALAAHEMPLSLSRWDRIHHDLQSMARVIERVAGNDLIDRLLEAAWQAEGQGVGPEAFHAAIDVLTMATKRKGQNGTGPQPAFLPAPVPSHDNDENHDTDRSM